MTAKKRSIKSDLTKVDAHRITKAEYDEIGPSIVRRFALLGGPGST